MYHITETDDSRPFTRFLQNRKQVVQIAPTLCNVSSTYYKLIAVPWQLQSLRYHLDGTRNKYSSSRMFRNYHEF